MAYEATRYPSEIHFYASLLSDHRNIHPDRHYHWYERIEWLALKDTLLR